MSEENQQRLLHKDGSEIRVHTSELLESIFRQEFPDGIKPPCEHCGKDMTLVRPSKYQCDNINCVTSGVFNTSTGKYEKTK